MTIEQAAPMGRAHEARQVRAAVVAMAKEYRAACRQHEEMSAYVLRLDIEAPTWLLKEEERMWEAMEGAREALFGALEELERVEGEGR